MQCIFFRPSAWKAKDFPFLLVSRSSILSLLTKEFSPSLWDRFDVLRFLLIVFSLGTYVVRSWSKRRARKTWNSNHQRTSSWIQLTRSRQCVDALGVQWVNITFTGWVSLTDKFLYSKTDKIHFRFCSNK